MSTPTLPRGTRVETIDQCAQIRAAAPSRDLRSSVDAICEAFPGLSRAWVKRHHRRLMDATTSNMATLIDNALTGRNRDGLLAVQVKTICYLDPTGEHAANRVTYGGGER